MVIRHDVTVRPRHDGRFMVTQREEKQQQKQKQDSGSLLFSFVSAVYEYGTLRLADSLSETPRVPLRVGFRMTVRSFLEHD